MSGKRKQILLRIIDLVAFKQEKGKQTGTTYSCWVMNYWFWCCLPKCILELRSTETVARMHLVKSWLKQAESQPTLRMSRQREEVLSKGRFFQKHENPHLYTLCIPPSLQILRLNLNLSWVALKWYDWMIGCQWYGSCAWLPCHM